MPDPDMPDMDDAQVPLRARLDELARRFMHVARRLDLRERFVAHPFKAVGIAALAGAWFGFTPLRKRPRTTATSKISDAVLATCGAIAVRLVREAAFREAATVAKQWWAESAYERPSEPSPTHAH